jgi:hypothetical protein
LTEPEPSHLDRKREQAHRAENQVEKPKAGEDFEDKGEGLA